MVLGLVLLLVLCIGVVLLFNTGQVVNKKVELVNAADAAAYSVAVQQARALNYAAYMNRARVANEVAIAQTISIYSWLNQMNTTTVLFKSAMDVLSLTPTVGVAFKAIATVMEVAGKVIKGVREGYNPAAKVIVKSLDTVNQSFALSSLAVMDGVSNVDSYTIAGDVLKKNSPGATLGTIGQGVLAMQLASARSTFLTKYRIPTSKNARREDRAGADRFRNVVMQSRDEFSRNRSDQLVFGLIVQSGGTDMVGYDRWAAMDTLAVSPSVTGVDVPLGWGGAQALNRYKKQRFLPGFDNGRGWYSDWDSNRHKPYGDAADRSPDTALMVDSDANAQLSGYGAHRKAFFTGYKGLSDYHDVKEGKALQPYAAQDKDRDNVGPVFTVYAETDIANAHTRSTTQGGAPTGSRIALDDKAQQGKLAAISSAQVYFNRPVGLNIFKRADGKREVGNLFSPYWQARLVKTDAKTQAMLATAGALMP